MTFAQRCRSIKEAAQLSLTSPIGEVSERILSEVVLETIRTYRQKLAVGIEDSASDLLQTFKRNVADHIFNTSTGWRIVQQDNFLFPRGCRWRLKDRLFRVHRFWWISESRINNDNNKTSRRFGQRSVD